MPDQPQRKRRVLWGPLTVIVMLVLIVVAQLVAPSTSYQLANMASGVFLVIGLIAFLVSWLRLFRQPRWLRWAPVALLVAGLIAIGTIFELVGVSGELVPQFRNRFADRGALPSAAELEELAQAERWTVVVDETTYPGFLGHDRRGTFEPRPLTTDFQQQPPQLLWRQPVGQGLAGVAVVRVQPTQTNDSPDGEVTENPDTAPTDTSASASEPPSADTSSMNDLEEPTGKAWRGYTIEQREGSEWVTCYDMVDGTLLWSHQQEGRHSHFLGDVGPRTTPSVDAQGRVFAQGATGHVWCLDGISGELIWHVDLLDLAGINQTTSEKYVLWGRSGSPLRVDDLVVLPLGGDPESAAGTKSLVALEAATGAVRWTSGSHQISYASPVLATLDGQRQILSVDQDFVSGTAVEDGQVLWTIPWPGASNSNANCSNPIAVDKQRVLVTKEYGGGAMLFRVEQEGDEWTAEEEWSKPNLLKTKFTNAVLDGDYAYAISNGTLECVDVNEAQRMWAQSRGERFEHGHVLAVGDLLVCSTEIGEIVLVRKTPERYEELGRFQAINGKTWNPPSVFGHYVCLRNGSEMAVFDIGAGNSNQIAQRTER